MAFNPKGPDNFLSAFPDLFDEEKLTQGGLPSIIDVFGIFSISFIELSKSPNSKVIVTDGKVPYLIE